VFIRYIAPDSPDQNPWLATGLITVASIFARRRISPSIERTLIREVFDWFDLNLDCPPFQKKIRTKEWSDDAVCWFRESATEHLKRMDTLSRILRRNGILVATINSNYPGKIVYRDKHQIVAETPKRQLSWPHRKDNGNPAQASLR
jgi:hypothetical protein